MTAPTHPSPGHTGTASTTLYVYAICRSDGPRPDLTGLSGHDSGGPVYALALADLTAVVQEVPAHAFSEESLRQRLSERHELERCARTHHEVIARAAEHADTVPLPLATLYLGEDGVRDAIRANERRFRTALDRVAGRVEWGVKVYAESTTGPTAAVASSPEASSPQAAGSDDGPAGRAYLERARGRQRERERRTDASLRAAETVHAAFREYAAAACRLRTHGSELTGETRPQLLNAAYLFAAGADRQVAGVAARLRSEPGIAVEVTGPWVPYSFAEGGAGDGGR